MCFGNLADTGATQGTKNEFTSFTGTKTGTNQNQISVDPGLGAQANENIGYLTDTRNNGYQPFPGERVAPMTNDEGMMAQQNRDMTASAMPEEAGTAKSYFRYYGDAPQQHVDTERVVDEGGKLGAISDYTSPYIKEALDPQLQDLDEEGMRRNKEMNSRAAMSGAFGDTGWEFGRAREADLTRRARDSAIGNAHQQAWDRAMSLRGADAARFLDVDKSNAAYAEQHLDRMKQAGQEMERLGFMNDQNRLAVQNALMKSAQSFRANDQAKLDAAYQEFSRATGFPLEVAKMLIGAINGSPLNKQLGQTGSDVNTTVGTGNTVGSSTTNTQAVDNSGFKLLGTLLGAAF